MPLFGLTDTSAMAAFLSGQFTADDAQTLAAATAAAQALVTTEQVARDAAIQAAIASLSSTAKAAPGPATITNVNPAVSSQVTVTFTDPTNTGSSAINSRIVNVYKDSDHTTIVASSANGVSPRTVTGLTDGVPYVCRVREGNADSATVGFTDSVFSAVFTTPTPITGTGGRVAMLNALGAANGGGNDWPNYVNGTQSRWAQMNTGAPGTTAPIRYCYLEAQPQNTALLGSVLASASNWLTAPTAISGAVIPNVRMDLCTQSVNLAAVAAGGFDAAWTTTGQQLAQMYAASGIPPRVTLGWEATGWWFWWSIGGVGGNAQVWNGTTTVNIVNAASDFYAAWKRAVGLMKAQCPQALFDLVDGGPFLMNGQAGQWSSPVDTTLATAIVAGLAGTIVGGAANGKKYLDGWGTDVYNDGWSGASGTGKIGLLTTSAQRLSYFNTCMAAEAAFALANGLPFCLQELGIADPLHASNLIATADYVNGFYSWGAALPAPAATPKAARVAGSLDRYLVFDENDGTTNHVASTNWRGWSWVATEGPIAVNTLLTALGYGSVTSAFALKDSASASTVPGNSAAVTLPLGAPAAGETLTIRVWDTCATAATRTLTNGSGLVATQRADTDNTDSHVRTYDYQCTGAAGEAGPWTYATSDATRTCAISVRRYPSMTWDTQAGQSGTGIFTGLSCASGTTSAPLTHSNNFASAGFAFDQGQGGVSANNGYTITDTLAGSRAYSAEQVLASNVATSTTIAWTAGTVGCRGHICVWSIN